MTWKGLGDDMSYVLSNTNANPYDFFADVDLTTNFYVITSGQVFSSWHQLAKPPP